MESILNKMAPRFIVASIKTAYHLKKTAQSQRLRDLSRLSLPEMCRASIRQPNPTGAVSIYGFDAMLTPRQLGLNQYVLGLRRKTVFRC